MSAPRSVLPQAAGEDEAAPGSSPILVDGMEVLSHRTVGLYPVRIEPAPAAAPVPQPSGADPRRSANGANLRR